MLDFTLMNLKFFIISTKPTIIFNIKIIRKWICWICYLNEFKFFYHFN